MCLNIRLGKRIMKKDTTIYRVVEVRDGLYYSCLFDKDSGFHHGVNRAVVCPVVYMTKKGRRMYPSGYHCFTKRSDAKIYKEEFLEALYKCLDLPLPYYKIVVFTIPQGVKTYAGYTKLENTDRKMYTLVSPILVLK